MASCGLPGCPSKAKSLGSRDSSKSLGSRPPPSEGRPEEFKGPCGLPDCRNEGAAKSQQVETASTSQKNAQKQEKSCDIPGCQVEDARARGMEVCLYRGPQTSFFGRAGDLYKLFWTTWKKIQTDPYYWSLFKSIVYFVFGLKLYRDLAINFKSSRRPKCR